MTWEDVEGNGGAPGRQHLKVGASVAVPRLCLRRREETVAVGENEINSGRRKRANAGAKHLRRAKQGGYTGGEGAGVLSPALASANPPLPHVGT